MKKKRRKLRINRVIILLLFVFMICFGVILFIRSDFFSLKNIKIVNNDILTKTEVKNLSNINTGKNLFSYDIEKIKTNINKYDCTSKKRYCYSKNLSKRIRYRRGIISNSIYKLSTRFFFKSSRG